MLAACGNGGASGSDRGPILSETTTGTSSVTGTGGSSAGTDSTGGTANGSTDPGSAGPGTGTTGGSGVGTGTTGGTTTGGTTTGGTTTGGTTTGGTTTGGTTVPTTSGTGTSGGSTGSTGTAGGTGSSGSPVVVQSLTVTPASAAIPVGAQQAFTASALLSDGSRQDVTATAHWSSSDSSIASVDASGLASGIATGAVTIAATVGGVSGSAALTVAGGTLTAISITPSTVSLPAGVNVSLTATGLYSDHTSRDVTTLVAWSTGNRSIATFTAVALLSGVSAGATTVNATLGGVSASADVNVTAATLQSLTVNPGALSLPVGFSDQLAVTATYSDGAPQTVTGQVAWTSSDVNVASVDATGRVTARATGSAMISGSLNGGGVSVSVTVTDATLIAVQVAPDFPSMPPGVQVNFTATGIFSDQTTRDLTAGVTWTLANAAVATLSNTGVACGSAPGSTSVTASIGAFSDSTTLTVTNASLTALDVLPPAVSIAYGTEAVLQAMATDSDGLVWDVTRQAVWTSDDRSVAVSLDDKGRALVKGLAVGSANVTATFGTLLPDAAAVTVTADQLLSIAVTPSSPTLLIHQTQQLTATGTFSNQPDLDLSTEVIWTSSNDAVASVSATGVVTGLQSGSATITATLLGISSSTTVKVTNATVVSLAVVPSSATLPAGFKAQFVATAQLSDSTTADVTSQVLWSTANAAVVTISNASNSKGLATGVAASALPVTVSATLGTITVSASVKVTSERLTTIVVSPNPFTAVSRKTVQLSATGTFSGGTTLDLTKQCSWKSNAKRTARVSQSGVVTAAKKGDVTITATKAGVSGTAKGSVS